MAFASFKSSPMKDKESYEKYDGLHLFKGKWRVQVTSDRCFDNALDAQKYRKQLISHMKKRRETPKQGALEKLNIDDAIDQMVSPIKWRRARNRDISTADGSIMSTRRRMRKAGVRGTRSKDVIKAAAINETRVSEFGDHGNLYVSNSAINLQDWNTGTTIYRGRDKVPKSSSRRPPRNRLEPEYERPKILRRGKYQDPDSTLYNSPRSYCRQTLKKQLKKEMLQKAGKTFNPKYIPLTQSLALTSILQRQNQKELDEKRSLEQSYGFLGDFRDKYTYEKTHLDIFCHQLTKEHRRKNPLLANE